MLLVVMGLRVSLGLVGVLGVAWGNSGRVVPEDFFSPGTLMFVGAAACLPVLLTRRSRVRSARQIILVFDVAILCEVILVWDLTIVVPLVFILVNAIGLTGVIAIRRAEHKAAQRARG